MKRLTFLIPLGLLCTPLAAAQSGPAPSNMPPCYANPVQGCLGPMPSPSYSQPSRPLRSYEGATYGAYIISQPEGSQSWDSFATVANYKDPGQAKAAALKSCSEKYRNCRVLFTFTNTCAGLASGDYQKTKDDDYLAVGVGTSEETAKADAVRNCQLGSIGNCHPVHAICSLGYFYKDVDIY